MIQQTNESNQPLGSGHFPFLVYKDKNESSTEEKIEKILLDSLENPSILPFPQEWEKTSFTPKPKTDFIQKQNREKKVSHKLEIHFGGGTSVRLVRSEEQPLEYHTQIPNQVRGDRTSSNGFSKKSRRNVLKKLSDISQDRIPKDRIKMITLTYDGREHFENKYSPKDCKGHLNSFLTRVRKHLKGKGVKTWFYHWKVEPQVKRYLRLGGSPVLHFHLTLFNVSYIDQDWVRETWSRIVCGWGDYDKRPKDLVRTKTETPRNWNNSEQYMNKVLCYISKGNQVLDKDISDFIRKKKLDQETSFRRLEKLQSMKYGRIWGIGRYDDYWKFVDRMTIELDPEHTSRLINYLLQYTKSNLMRSQGDKFDHQKWKEFEKYYRTGRITKKYKTCRVHLDQQFKEFSTFMRGERMLELLELLDIPIIECEKEIKIDVVIDFTPDDYTRRVVGL